MQVARLVGMRCWSLARREFYSISTTTGLAAAHEILEQMAALFEIELSRRGHAPKTRPAARQTKSVPRPDELAVMSDQSCPRSVPLVR